MSKERSLFADSKEQTMIEAKENLRKRLALNAAAPEMLEMLKDMPTIGLSEQNRVKLKALIDKAEGKE